MSLKRQARNAKFQAIAEELTTKIRKWRQQIGDPDMPDYETGKASKFHVERDDKQNRDETDPLNQDKRCHTEVPYGPKFNTPQWVRTT